MSLGRRLSCLRPRGHLLLLLVTLPILAMTWRHFTTNVSVSQFEPQSQDVQHFQINKPDYVLPRAVNLSGVVVTAERHGGNDSNSVRTPPEVFEERKKRWMDVCTKNPGLPGAVHGVFPHKSGVLYCFVPKAGCTFWKQVFNYANSGYQTKARYATPWDYPRLLVHGNHMSKGRRFVPGSDEQKYPMRVIVTRDPFSRILSSYLDKFYLPDFWIMVGKGLKAKEAQTHYDQSATNFFDDHFQKMDEMFKHTYKNGARRDCASRLTFARFLRTGLSIYEPHWLPVHTICNPCKLKPTHVITMETFTSDARTVMKQMGLDHFLDGFDPVQQTNTEIETIVKYNFDRIFLGGTRYQAEFENCVSHEELAYRLWKNFQWRGYIHPDFNYVLPESGTNVKEDLRRQLVKAREAAIKDPAACKQFKNDFKIQAFKSLGKHLFETIVTKFRLDTELFGHEKIIEKMRSIYD